MNDCNYFPIDYNAGNKDHQSSEITEDDLWNDDNSLREGIQEAAYSEQFFQLLRDIRNPRKDADKAYTELGKLAFEHVDNYIFKVGESDD